jgi:hypothetical protein
MSWKWRVSLVELPMYENTSPKLKSSNLTTDQSPKTIASIFDSLEVRRSRLNETQRACNDEKAHC